MTSCSPAAPDPQDLCHSDARVTCHASGRAQTRMDPPWVPKKLDVDDGEACRRERTSRGKHCVVLEMLVIDRVELAEIDQVQRVVDLDAQPPVVGEQVRGATGEAEQVRNVGVDVVGDNKIRRSMLGTDPAARSVIEECRLGRNAALTGGRSHIHRRLDAEARYVPGDRMLKQVPVVARHLDHERVVSQVQPSAAVVDERLRVADPAVRVRGEYAYSVNVSSGVISAGICKSRQSSHTRRCSGYVGSGMSSSSAVRNFSHGGVAPRSTTLTKRIESHSRHRTCCPYLFHLSVTSPETSRNDERTRVPAPARRVATRSFVRFRRPDPPRVPSRVRFALSSCPVRSPATHRCSTARKSGDAALPRTSAISWCTSTTVACCPVPML